MGQIANQMALELFFKIKERMKEKRENKKLDGGKAFSLLKLLLKNSIFALWRHCGMKSN